MRCCQMDGLRGYCDEIMHGSWSMFLETFIEGKHSETMHFMVFLPASLPLLFIQ